MSLGKKHDNEPDLSLRAEEGESILAEDSSEMSLDESEERLQETLEKLKKKLGECEKERQEYLLGWQRAKADFVNARRTEEEERKTVVSYAKEGVLLSFLTVADSFDLAFANKKAWEAVPEEWRKGVLHIYSQLVKVLEENGLRETAPLGETFDPMLHESVESVPTGEESEQGKIATVLQKGYELNGKIVRPAKVTVWVFQTKN